MRVLVVGASGVVGGAIASRLARSGADVVAASRRGLAPEGEPVALDVTAPGLGLAASVSESLRSSLTHVVSCFGSVDWDSTPRTALETHARGTDHLLDFAQRCPRLERFVHVSSVLVFGRARGPVDNRVLDVGQAFRNWYEYGKYLAELAVRARDLPWRVVRLGPILGVSEGRVPDPRHGLLAALPHLLRGYPAHLERRGRFPCYVGDVEAASGVVTAAVVAGGASSTWTWFDAALPSLADVLAALSQAWGVVPRLLDLPVLEPVSRLLAERLGLPAALLDYARPWFDLAASVLGDLPDGLPECRPGYVEQTGEALRAAARAGRVRLP